MFTPVYQTWNAITMKKKGKRLISNNMLLILKQRRDLEVKKGIKYPAHYNSFLIIQGTLHQ